MRANGLRVRPMVRRDIDEVMAVQTDAYVADLREHRSVLEGRLEIFPHGCWIAEESDATLGYLLSHPWDDGSPPDLDRTLQRLPEAPACYYIHDLAVRSSARGRGVGPLLAEAAFGSARELGLTRLRLVAVQGSEPFWRSLGFCPVAPPTSTPGAGPAGYGAGASMMVAAIAEVQPGDREAQPPRAPRRVGGEHAMYDDVHPLVAERLRKTAELRAAGIDPYPVAAYRPTCTIPEIRRRAGPLVEASARARVAGRVVGRREMGKVAFVDLLDDGARLQAFIRRPAVGEQRWRVLDLVDLGDFLGVEGRISYTRTGELSVMVEDLTVLGKASHPMPLPKQQGERVFDAITDKGTLYRHRHIDLVCNQPSRETFLQRSRIIRGIRRYLDDEGFVEVETPIVGPAYGGAAARPFVTQVNALDQQMFLRISPECALKRLLCGGINKVYELGKTFRNEGIDASHNPEFTMVEWYEAYSDYVEQMVRFETIVARLCEEVHGSTHITYRDRPLDLTPPWRRLPMLDGLHERVGLDLRVVTVDEMPDVFRRHHPGSAAALPEPLTWGGAVVELFEALVEPVLRDPVFVIDHPVEVSPLTKRHRSDPRLVERFEPMIAGMEVGNSYSELNDPVEQYNRLVSQQVAREDAYDLDEDFLQAVAHGMPPAGGTGLGVDRIVMILTGAESIRDVVLFPFTSRQQSEPDAADAAKTKGRGTE